MDLPGLSRQDIVTDLHSLKSEEGIDFIERLREWLEGLRETAGRDHNWRRVLPFSLDPPHKAIDGIDGTIQNT